MIDAHQFSLTNDPDPRVREQAIILLQNITTTAQEIVFTVNGLGTERLIDIFIAAMSQNDSETVEHVSSLTFSTQTYTPLTRKFTEYTCIKQHHNRIPTRHFQNEQATPHIAQNEPFTFLRSSPTRFSQLHLRASRTVSFPTS